MDGCVYGIVIECFCVYDNNGSSVCKFVFTRMSINLHKVQEMVDVAEVSQISKLLICPVSFN
jgi:hypothetical protein